MCVYVRLCVCCVCVYVLCVCVCVLCVCLCVMCLCVVCLCVVLVTNNPPGVCVSVYICGRAFGCVFEYALVCVGNQRASARMYVCVGNQQPGVSL